MSLAVVTQWKVHPGRNAEFQELTAQAVGIHRRLGLTVRVFQATAAGPNTGQVSYVMESKDRHEWANLYDAMNADEEWQALFARFSAADAPGVVVSQTLANEITPD